MVIGNLERFGFEVLSDDFSSELAEIYIVVSGRRVSEALVYVPTFIPELAGYMIAHDESPPTDFDFGGMSDAEAVALLGNIWRTGQRHVAPPFWPVRSEHVDDYYRMHSLDDAVDRWEIYVFDVECDKRIVCRPIAGGNDDEPNLNSLVSARLPREEFVGTIAELAALFKARLSPRQQSWMQERGHA